MGRSQIQFRSICLGAAAVLAGLLALGGCCSDVQCEPPLSEERTPAADANLPDAWTRGDITRFRIVVTTGPYRVGDYALDHLIDAMSEQAGLTVEAVEGADTGLPASGTVSEDDVVAAARAQIPPGDDAVLVIVVVDRTTVSDATYGFIGWDSTSRPTAVMGLHRSAMRSIAGGIISSEVAEAATVVHEVGHWLGIPARAFHTSSIDGAHCTNGRCVMFKGSRVNVCVVLANLCSGVPLRFCSDCAAELAEMQRRRNEDTRRSTP